MSVEKLNYQRILLVFFPSIRLYPFNNQDRGYGRLDASQYGKIDMGTERAPCNRTFCLSGIWRTFFLQFLAFRSDLLLVIPLG